MQTLNRSDHREQYNFLPSALLDKMDHHQKIQMVVVPQQSKIKIEDDDDEDVEALRLAALKSLRTKDTTHKRSTLSQVPKVLPQVTQSSRFSYKNQRPIKRNFYSNRVQQRQNGNMYYQSPRNPNLIAIVPVDEPSPLQQPPLSCPIEKTEPRVELSPQVSEISKFHRFKDNGSASEEEDTKEQKSIVTSVKTDLVAKEEPEQSLAEVESQEEITKSPQKNGDNQEEDGNDDDDDIILMADIEEENSLERLMDEMEREMNDGNKPSEKREKKLNKEETKVKMSDEGSKSFEQKTKSDEICSKKERNTTTLSLTTVVRNDRRSDSPHIVNRVSQKRKSLSPRSRSRKKSPKRSPRRSPVRQPKKSPRESTRYRSPRRSPSSRYSPRSRSPRLSPRRSPNRTSMKRSPPRKLSPRGRSPKLSSRSRSPRPHRSRSPRRLSRSKSPRPRSPKVSRSRSPRLSRSRSPRYSPLLRSPRSKSPRLSPRRMSPRRLRSRSRSPALSPPRREPSRLRSPKGSPRRTSPRLRSPRLSPHRSPWSSPRHSPRLSPRRRRSPKWSPKELPRKHGPRSITPDNRDGYAREPSPIFKGAVTPEMPRAKIKQKDEVYERPTTTTETAKESVDTISDPVLEARRKKFESTRPIDPVNANKKIKLSKKYTTNTKAESSEEMEIQSSTIRKTNKTLEEYEVQEMDLCLETSYEFEEFEEAVENTSPSVITSSVNTCIDIEPQKTEKEKSSKKKKKRDKELYQVGGKLKNELPLSERIGKDKKCKKRKEIISEEDVDTIFEDMAIDTEEGDLRTELSRRRAERLNRPVPIQSARLVQSAFKGVVNDAVKNNAKVNQRHVINTDEKSNQKEVRRVTVLHRSPTYLHDSEDESTLDSKVPVRFRLGLNKQPQESRESKVTRKASKRQGRKVKHKNHLSLKDAEHIL